MTKLLLPETLDSSKIINIISDSKLSFKITDLLSINEVSKISQVRSEVLSLLEHMDFIKLSENKEYAHYNIVQDFCVFSFLNVPQKTTEEELLILFGLKKENVTRLYKKSLFWILVIVKESDEVNEIVKRLKEVRFQNTELKYEYLNRNQLVKNINKQIQTSNYHKESHELKCEKKEKSNNYASNSNNYNSNVNNKDRTNSEALSWRKRSNDQGSFNVNVNSSVASVNSPKMSIE